jgi:superfamily I DNA/RNA helicase
MVKRIVISLSVIKGTENPDVIFVDEAQDFTKLQHTLVRGWGEQSQWVVLVGDDDQTIFGFASATPDSFLNPPIDAKYKRILDQSYRVPASVLKLSQKMIRQVSFREEKIYSPRKTNGKIVEGVVRELEEGYREPETIIDDVRKLIAKGKAVMLLTTCAYMLDPIKRELKKKGLPFWNPYRKERGDWNPLRGGSTTNTSKDMVLNFLIIRRRCKLLGQDKATIG